MLFMILYLMLSLGGNEPRMYKPLTIVYPPKDYRKDLKPRK